MGNKIKDNGIVWHTQYGYGKKNYTHYFKVNGIFKLKEYSIDFGYNREFIIYANDKDLFTENIDQSIRIYERGIKY